MKDYNTLEAFHDAIREAKAILDQALQTQLPDPDTEAGHYEILNLRALVDKLDMALFRGLYGIKPKIRPALKELTLEDLGLI